MNDLRIARPMEGQKMGCVERVEADRPGLARGNQMQKNRESRRPARRENRPLGRRQHTPVE